MVSRDERMEMYKAYKHELQKIEGSGDLSSERVLEGWYESLNANAENGVVRWINIKSGSGKTEGFAVIRYNNDFDMLFIHEFYILPEYRRRRVGSNAIDNILTKHKADKVYMVIVDNNHPAKEFWQKLMRTHRYKIIREKPYRPRDDYNYNETEYLFQKEC